MQCSFLHFPLPRAGGPFRVSPRPDRRGGFALIRRGRGAGSKEDDQVVVIPDGYLSRKQVAELFRVDPQTLSQWVQAGKLEGSLYEGRWVFAADTIRALLGGERPVLEWRAVADRLAAEPPPDRHGPDDARPSMPMPMQGVHALRPGDTSTVCGKPVEALQALEPAFVNVNIVLRCPTCDAAVTLERHAPPDSRDGSP
jgi:hypothetical protein